jgi:adenine-specific DNA-methyltransferase
MSKYNELVKKLKEIFQIDRPELDFGIYRILNSKADDINDYLDKQLKQKIILTLATAGNANKEELEIQLNEAIKGAEALGVDADSVPKVQDLKKQIVDVSKGGNEHENTVFTHLLTFFSRYYDSGDFVSKRRYKGDTYAIPYAGEEVMLHWANKDQYYIKSGENFANYSFKLEDGRKVSFKLLSADTAKDNRKDNDVDRRFVLIEPHVRLLKDDDSNEYEEEFQPVSVTNKNDNDELIIQFEYKAMKKGTKQINLVDQAVQTINNHKYVQANWIELEQLDPTEKNPNRTILEKHLTTYTQRNTADYFIHKDLGGFLSNELDFYIKNEVMNLDNVQNAEIFADIEKQLRMIQCLRSIALDIIAFLAQIENFQKNLWKKKKFVTGVEYLITLNKIPNEILSLVISNQTQIKQWQKLGLINKDDDLSITYLLKNKSSLMVDTFLFDDKFKESILSNLDIIDDSIDGLLFHSDNYHALNLIEKKYNSAIDCIHIDPPYNTFSSGFLYKNNYQHSSWLSLMESRLKKSRNLLSDQSCYQAHIDENEYEELYKLFELENFNYQSTVLWDKKNPMMGGKGVAIQHEYIIWCSNSDEPFPTKNDNVLSMLEYKDKLFKQYGKINEQCRTDFAKWVQSNKKLTGGEKAYKYIEDDGSVYRHVAMTWPNPNKAPDKFFIPLIHPKTGKECAVPTRGWSRSPEKLKELIDKNEMVFGEDHKTIPQRKIFLTTNSRKPLASVINNGKKGKAELENMGLEFSYCHPISLYEDILYAGLRGKNQGLILDFFAGSGTTAQAIMSLNLFDDGSRKYILMEHGEYFNRVTKPRLIKSVFSLDWKKSIPQNCSQMEHIIKVVSLESYEDTLNNLEIKKPQQTDDLFGALNEEVKSDYLINYMLETESKASLLSIDDFKKPFDYKMNIAVDSAGASEEKNINLVETFNYLIGLHVKTIESNIERGFVRIEGILPNSEKALILWRDCEKIQYEDFTKFANRFDLFAKEKTFDVIYVNGDHNLPTAFTSDDDKITRTLKLRQIEPEFLELMFASEERQ